MIDVAPLDGRQNGGPAMNVPARYVVRRRVPGTAQPFRAASGKAAIANPHIHALGRVMPEPDKYFLVDVN